MGPGRAWGSRCLPSVITVQSLRPTGFVRESWTSGDYPVLWEGASPCFKGTGHRRHEHQGKTYTDTYTDLQILDICTLYTVHPVLCLCMYTCMHASVRMYVCMWPVWLSCVFIQATQRERTAKGHAPPYSCRSRQNLKLQSQLLKHLRGQRLPRQIKRDYISDEDFRGQGGLQLVAEALPLRVIQAREQCGAARPKRHQERLRNAFAT